MKYKISVVLCWLFAVSSFAGLQSPSIIPLPVQMQVNPGTFTLCPATVSTGVPAHATTQILVDSNSLATGQYLAALLFRSTGYQFQIATNNGTSAVKNAILLTTVNANESLGAEGYELTVAPDSVVARAPAEAGVFYAVQSLLQLLPPQVLSLTPATNIQWVAPCVYIYDYPRFAWRGWMMDESRHFFGKKEVKKFMDAMALQKMNTFHWHLVDDEGWRIEIKSYPLLTSVAGWRNGWTNTQNNGVDFGQNPRVSTATNALGQYGGFYTQDEIKEIVAYAQQRHITIVPEIEMPAHCTSGLYAYPQFGCGHPQSSYIMDVNSQQNINYGVCLFSLGTNAASTNAGIPFLENVLTEVANLFPGSYIHCGGDEVIATGDTEWTTFATDSNQMKSLGFTGPSTHTNIVNYQHWFSTNICAYLKSKGKTMVGWTEFEAGGIVSNAVLQEWQTGSSSYVVQAATNGQKVVMSPNIYTYLNYYMSTNGKTSGTEYPTAEPYFNSVAYLPLSKVYGFEPVPTNLPAQFSSNIIGAECAQWAEYIPSTKNEEFKAFPRVCAMAELSWTPAAQKNFIDFTQRLVTHEQRLSAMGMNFDNTNAITIGTWGPTVATNTSPPTTVTYDISAYVTNSGEIDLDFHYTGGGKAINIYSVSLYENGNRVDADNTGYVGYSGLSSSNLPFFVLFLKTYHPGSTYTVQANIAGYGGTTSSGTVYLVNWN